MDILESFVIHASKFLEQYDDSALMAMRSQLYVLTACNDLSVFDPSTSAAARFYASLLECVRRLSAGAPAPRALDTVWAAAAVLSTACQNAAARRALAHTHRAAAVLARLLQPARARALPHEGRLALLRALQDVSYGVEVSWREAQVPGLLQTLAAWAAEGAADGADEPARQLVAPALAALVNLCQRNLPAVVALMRAVDTRAFLATLLSRKDPSAATKLQVCKLVVTVKQVQGGLQDSDVLSFCEAAFCAVGDALAAADAFLLRQIVDFFEDVRNDDRCRSALLRYDNFRKDTEGVLGQLKDSPKPQCVSLLLQFLLPLVQLRVPELAALYPDVAALALKWIVGETAGTAAMMVLCAIVSAVCGHRDDGLQAEEHKMVGREVEQVRDAVLDLIEARIPTLAALLDLRSTAPSNGDGDGGGGSGGGACSRRQQLTDTETRQRIAALLQLLRVAAGASSSLAEQILTEIPYKSVTALFQPLLSTDKEESLFQEETINLHLQALQLLLQLSSWREEWGDALWSCLRQPLLQLLLAAALLAGAPHHKAQALKLLSTPGFLQECGASLSERLCELQPLLVVPYSSARAAGRVAGAFRPRMDESMQQDLTPLFTIAQEGRLNQMMARLQDAFENKEIRDVSVSAIVDLYRCKIAALGNSEKALYARLEKADEEASRSQQLLSHALDGASRLLQRSKHSAELLEEARADIKERDNKVSRLEEAKTRLESALTAAEERCEVEEQRAEQLEQQLQKATASARDLQRDMQQLAEKSADQVKLIRRLQEKVTRKKEEVKNLQNEVSTSQLSLEAARDSAAQLQHELAVSRAEAAAVRATLASRDVELQGLRATRKEIARLSAKADPTTA